MKFQDKVDNDLIQGLDRNQRERYAKRLADKLGLEYVNPVSADVVPNVIQIISEEKARKSNAIALKLRKNNLTVGINSPHNPHLKELVASLVKRGYKVSFATISIPTLKKLWRVYKEISSATKAETGLINISSENMLEEIKEINSIQDVKDKIQKILESKKLDISDLLELIIVSSVSLKSSDIHFEVYEKEIRVRFRIDGILTNITNISPDNFRLISSRIKLISGMKITGKIAQDGRFTIKEDAKDIEVRVSTVPSSKGESIVMRILDSQNIIHKLSDLGIEEKLYNILKKEVLKPNGAIITTGPTGAGKTTTLYSFINQIYNPHIKIITIEDPIEYKFKGIVQTQISKKGYSFAGGLRAILRQDPDVIMIGEIRDKEVAETALNASLTGHLVFSTLHTNDAFSAVQRFIDLEIDPKVIGSAINVVLAQRLVRKIVKEKVINVAPPQKDQDMVMKIFDSFPDEYKERVGTIDFNTFLSHKTGTSEDDLESYKGRCGIYEALLIDQDIRKAINGKKGAYEIKQIARKQNLLTMKQDAILKVINGITSLEEVKRIVDIYSEEYE